MRMFHEPSRMACGEIDRRDVDPQGGWAVRRTCHQPSRGIGGETASRMAARRVDLPGRGKSSNITEDVRKYAAEQGVTERAALEAGMEEKARQFVEKGAELYAPA